MSTDIDFLRRLSFGLKLEDCCSGHSGTNRDEQLREPEVLTFLNPNVWEIFVRANAEQVILNSSFFFHSFVVGKVFLLVMRIVLILIYNTEVDCTKHELNSFPSLQLYPPYYCNSLPSDLWKT